MLLVRKGRRPWFDSLVTEFNGMGSGFKLFVVYLGPRSELFPRRGLVAAGEVIDEGVSLLVWAEMLDSALNIVWATSSLMALPRVNCCAGRVFVRSVCVE